MGNIQFTDFQNQRGMNQNFVRVNQNMENNVIIWFLKVFSIEALKDVHSMLLSQIT
jgi:hypothetical protein